MISIDLSKCISVLVGDPSLGALDEATFLTGGVNNVEAVREAQGYPVDFQRVLTLDNLESTQRKCTYRPS